MSNIPKKPTKRPSTLNRGAADDRAAIKAHVIGDRAASMTLTMHQPDPSKSGITQWIRKDRLIDFIDGMASRADHRKGGRGRKFVAEPKGKPKQRPAGNK